MEREDGEDGEERDVDGKKEREDGKDMGEELFHSRESVPGWGGLM